MKKTPIFVIFKIGESMKKKYLKKELKKMKKYLFISFIFSLILTNFNYMFMVFSLCSDKFTGMYALFFQNNVINVLFNTIFDLVFFTFIFFTYTYLLIEKIIKA